MSGTSYFCFGCTNIADDERTIAYVDWACRTGKFTGLVPPTDFFCGCPADAPTVPYTNPVDDNVCWYDPLLPESAEFLGVVVHDVAGLRTSSFSREVLDGIDGGSILTQGVLRGKELVFTVYLYATSQLGMDYGVEWIKRQIETDANCSREGSSCSSCQGQMMTIRTACPTGNFASRGLRSFSSAGSVDGFSLIEDSYPIGKLGCNVMREGTFTIRTESGYSFDTVTVSECEVSADEDYVFTQLGYCDIVAEVVDDPCTVDPGCDDGLPFTLTPEVVSASAPCFCTPPCRCVAGIGLANIPAGYDAALRLRLFSGQDTTNATFTKFGMRNTIVRVWENPDGLPLPVTTEEYDDLATRYVPCAELGISWMPAGAELVIDGLTGRSWLKCKGRCVDHSGRVTNIGGSIFPLTARCVPIIVTIEWDCLNAQFDGSAGKVVSSMRLESYLRHRL